MNSLPVLVKISGNNQQSSIATLYAESVMAQMIYHKIIARNFWLFHPLLSWVKFSDYIEPMVIFTTWAKNLFHEIISVIQDPGRWIGQFFLSSEIIIIAAIPRCKNIIITADLIHSSLFSNAQFQLVRQENYLSVTVSHLQHRFPGLLCRRINRMMSSLVIQYRLWGLTQLKKERFQ